MWGKKDLKKQKQNVTGMNVSSPSLYPNNVPLLPPGCLTCVVRDTWLTWMNQCLQRRGKRQWWGLGSLDILLSPNQINPLGKCCYFEHIISGDGYLKDEMVHQVAKVKMNFQVLQEIRRKEQTSLSLRQGGWMWIYQAAVLSILLY